MDPKPEDSKESDNDRGLKCRECGSRRFWVVYTRSALGGKVIRRRECRKCGERLTTWEREIGFKQ